MGRLEKQIIAGALALVGVLLSVVVYRGVERPLGLALEIPATRISEWSDPGDATPEKVATKLALTMLPAPTGDRAAPAPEPAAFVATPEVLVATSSSTLNPDLTLLVAVPTFNEAAIARTIVLPTADSWDEDLRIYHVREGDVLSRIAKRELGSISRMGEILKLNEGLEVDRLRVGQEITLPGGTTFLIPSSNAKTQLEASVAVNQPKTHKVAPGDNLWKIAQRYSVPGGPASLVQVNPDLLDKSTPLKIGWVLNIP